MHYFLRQGSIQGPRKRNEAVLIRKWPFYTTFLPASLAADQQEAMTAYSLSFKIAVMD